jgi:hypothetical protein
MYMSKIQLQQLATNVFLKRLVESVSGDASSIQQKAKQLASDLTSDGLDVSDDEVQAAMLGALVDADGDIEKIDVSDVEKIAKDIEESRLHEAGGALSYIHTAGDVLGNAAFINALSIGIEKLTGKQIDQAKLKARIKSIFGWIKDASTWVAHKIEQFIDWVAKKLGASETGAKIAGAAGLLIVTIILFAIGIVFFPSTGSTWALIFATLALIGKGSEMITLIKKIFHTIEAPMRDAEERRRVRADRGEASFGAE